VPNSKVFCSENRHMSNEYNTFKTGKQSLKVFLTPSRSVLLDKFVISAKKMRFQTHLRF
jgi:heat shock protein HslJ